MTREEARNVVSTEGWLAGRPAAFREELLRLAKIVRFRRGQTIYAVGDPPGGVYGLIEGSLRLELTVEGIGAQVGHAAHPGFWIGAASAIRREKRVLTLISASASSLFYLPLPQFEHLARDAENMRHFAVMAAGNNDLILSAARDLMNPDLKARIASRLLAIVGGADGAPSERPARSVAITQADLAMICNVSRKTMNNELSGLVGEGLVTLGYGRLVVNDREGLSRVARRRSA